MMLKLLSNSEAQSNPPAPASGVAGITDIYYPLGSSLLSFNIFQRLLENTDS